MSRIPDVGNPWLDAGIVPFSTLDYSHDREYWESGSRPTSSPRASRASSATGSTRMLAHEHGADDGEPPFKNVCSATP